MEIHILAVRQLHAIVQQPSCSRVTTSSIFVFAVPNSVPGSMAALALARGLNATWGHGPLSWWWAKWQTVLKWTSCWLVAHTPDIANSVLMLANVDLEVSPCLQGVLAG